MGGIGKYTDRIHKFKNSLRSRMVAYILLILILVNGVFEVYTYLNVKSFHYNNLKSTIHAQSKYNAELYLSYISDSPIGDNIDNNRLQFINNAQGQIQILDKSNVVIYDNNASDLIGKELDDFDVKSAFEGKPEYIIYTKEGQKLMSYTFPIINNDSYVGGIRVTSSLYELDSEIANKFNFFLAFGFFTLIFGAVVAYFISGKILDPINKLKVYANKLSDGRYSEKSNISYRGEIGDLAKTMDEMSENIIHKEQIKTEFISSVSHELRTPLTSIKGWSITLQDESVDKNILQEGLKIIEKESDRLSDMVEDLLDFSRFKSPKFNLVKSEFNLIDIVKNIINQLKPRTKEKDLYLLLNYDTEYALITADENRIKQVFINILDNAIKFTNEKGTIIVNIDYLTSDELVNIEVIDTGIGIGGDEISLVTTKFYKGQSSQSHTGLGLSICEEIIIRHEGDLQIESKLGQGTKITFQLPKGGEG